jgi:hypothetical protein
MRFWLHFRVPYHNDRDLVLGDMISNSISMTTLGLLFYHDFISFAKSSKVVYSPLLTRSIASSSSLLYCSMVR